jgi:membrane protease YdiL (CAAX protease family)
MRHPLLPRLAALPAVGRILTVMFVLVVVWLPFAIPIYAYVGDPDWVSIVSMLVLYAEFVAIVRLWGRWVHGEPHPLRRYGVVWNRQTAIELGRNLALGWAIVAVVFSLETVCGWVIWQAAPSNLVRIVIEGGVIAIAVASAEELVFRGWIWDELHRDYHRDLALPLSAIVFAALHYIRPLELILTTWPQFFGLGLLGLLLGWTKQIGQNRLGGSIGLHGGLVWAYYVVAVGQLVQYPETTPEWLTGIGGNPLAGLVGLTILTGVGVVLARRARSPRGSIFR